MYQNRKAVNNQVVNDLADVLNITPELAMVLAKRNKGESVNINELRDYLYADSVPCVPFPHVDEAVALLNKHILAGGRVAVINDYDVDGITSGFIASEMLRFLGVSTTIITSDRITGGYSISKTLVDSAKAFDADLIITTDNGITAFEQIAYAKELGMEVLITDHHEPVQENGQEKLPEADVIVEPQLADCHYPLREICGAAVIYKVAQRLLSEDNLAVLGRANLSAENILGGFAELAGVATIMDVMPLKGENRVLVRNALKRINSGSYFVGIRQLAAQMNIELGRITSNRISFGIGPCFNAESRMTGKIQESLKLLDTRDNNEAEKLAASLVSYNKARQTETAKLEESLNDSFMSDENTIVFQYIPHALHTLCGIIAGHITEATGKPCVVLTDNPAGQLTGSGRSVEGFNIIQQLRQYSHLFEKLGGHALACGMTISKENYDILVSNVNQDLADISLPVKPRLVDLYINPCFVRNAFLDELVLLEPYGEDNEELILMAPGCMLYDMRPFGKTGDYRKCRFLDNMGTPFEALLFSQIEKMENSICACFGAESLGLLKQSRGTYKLDLVYEARYHTWNGVTDIQFIMKDFQKAEE